jgi:glycosyltransferase involved in cell wall biosynthesis
MMSRPYVTALVDTYNHKRFIEDAVLSVLAQSFAPSETEVLVVDDGSTDGTADLVRKFEPRVKLLRKTNGGQASAFNAGIRIAQGEIVAFLDGDDWWAHQKLSRVCEVLSHEPSVGFVGHGITEVLSDGRNRAVCLNEPARFRCDSVEGARMFRTRKHFLGTSRMAIRASLLKRIMPVPESLVIEADEFLFTLAPVLSQTVILNECLTFYRHHDANLFQVSASDPARLRRKLQVLLNLSESLGACFNSAEVDLDPAIARTILEAVETEANQIRLSLDGGGPWDTLRTELRLLHIHHADASMMQVIYTMARLLPACVMPSKAYYRYRNRLASNSLYRSLRKRLLPFPEPRHSIKSETT